MITAHRPKRPIDTRLHKTDNTLTTVKDLKTSSSSPVSTVCMRKWSVICVSLHLDREQL